jgi:uncharacterized 2Fe-2S/4Fe-4S cluster protein (DUF4445 family)
MPTLHFIRENVSVTVPSKLSILAAARKAGIVIDAPCNGAGTCGKCKVKIRPQPPSPTPQPPDSPTLELPHSRTLEPPHSPTPALPHSPTPALPHSRTLELLPVLACQTHAGGADLAVETLAHADRDLKILADGHSLDVPIDPPIVRALALKPDAPRFGLAVDIGTTTLVASLVDLHTGAELATASALNPQARHAQDVLSRIKLGSTPDGLALLQRELTDELNRLAAQAAAAANVRPDRIYEAVYSGNTTMQHLAVAADPAPLGKFPYTPVLRGGESLPASGVGLALAPEGRVYLPPFMSAYVGADISSGILSTRLETLRGVTLFVDIGTNGEMVLAVDGALTATSTAAGPAFEGMNITHGMRAAPGAIERVTFSSPSHSGTGARAGRADGAIDIQTIGSLRAAGICGSGLLDAVGELARTGVIDKNGRIQKTGHPWEGFIKTFDGKPHVLLSDGVVYSSGESAPEITLSQKDIRQVQLAKAAVRAGIELMLAANGLDPARVNRVLIAGSFGFHLRAESLIHLGLLPAAFAGRIEFVGNTSKTGARALLLNADLRDALQRLVRRVRVLELANDLSFEKTFVKALSF